MSANARIDDRLEDDRPRRLIRASSVFGQFVCIVIEAKSVALNLFPRVIRFVRSEKCVGV